MRRAVAVALLSSGCLSLSPYGPLVLTDGNPITDTDPGSDTDPGGGGDTRPDDTPDTAREWGTADDPMFTEVVDGADNPRVRYVEVFNPSDERVSLNGWRINLIPDGVSGEIKTYFFPNVNLPSGGTFVVAFAGPEADGTGQAAYEDLFDTPANAYSDVISGNGNDAYILKDGTRIVDWYGELGVDGAGTAWDYTDKVAKRKTSVPGPNGAGWDASEWTLRAGQAEMNPGRRD